jgi:ketosteroid isomerase-like protein
MAYDIATTTPSITRSAPRVGWLAAAAMALSTLVLVAIVFPGTSLQRRRDREGVALAKSYVAAVNARDPSRLEAFLAPGFVLVNTDYGTTQHRQGFLAWATLIGRAYPDFTVAVDHVHVAGDVTVVRFHEAARQRRERVAFHGAGTIVMRVTGSRITTLWSNYDEFGLLRTRDDQVRARR